MDSALVQLIQRAFTGYSTSSSCGLVIKDVVPILWFGDMNAYFQSQKKIITVGYNPSYREFERDVFKLNIKEVVWRFPDLQSLVKSRGRLSIQKAALYCSALNNYFHYRPYEWFNHYEKILTNNFSTRPAQASYWNSLHDNIAIHIDVVPVATSVGWSSVNSSDKNQILKSFPCLFNDLIEYLDPDSIICPHTIQIPTSNSKIITIPSGRYPGQGMKDIDIKRIQKQL